jgi:hypothetical protein
MHYDLDSNEARSVSGEVDRRYGPARFAPSQPPRPQLPDDLWRQYLAAESTYRAHRGLWFDLGQACALLDKTADQCSADRGQCLAILRGKYTEHEQAWQAAKVVRDELAGKLNEFDRPSNLVEQAQ